MKKLFLIASFSIAMMANANENKEVEFNNSAEVELNNNVQTETSDAFFYGCGSQANHYYDRLMATGDYTHREARAARRLWVRECRGHGPNGWLEISLGWN